MDTTTRFAIQDLYADYTRCVDDSCYEEWPEFFYGRMPVPECFTRKLRSGIADVSAGAGEQGHAQGPCLRRHADDFFHAPYFQRHIVGIPKIISESDGVIVSEANYLVIRTKLDSFFPKSSTPAVTSIPSSEKTGD
ncbi:hypothetical protein ACFS07_19995 [Undibacterium arcticum]